MEVAPGRILSQRYRIVSQLGQGGFGKTFLAEDLHVPGQPKCVVKQLKPQSVDPATLTAARRLFENEAKILYQLGNHPQIPKLFAYFEENKDFYLVQEYVQGHELAKEIMASDYVKTEEQVLKIMEEILEILVFIHRKNVIHRDVNPRNLIRRHADGRLVLIDFGAVKQLTSQILREGMTVSTVAVGTPGYFPSEQSHGHPKFSSDVYAVGIIALQALTGFLPEKLPTHPESGEIGWHHLVKVTPEFRYILTRMVRYDYRQRYPSAVEALQAIKDLRNYRHSLSEIREIPQEKTQAVVVESSAQKPQIAQTSPLSKIFIFLGIIGIGSALFLGVDYWSTINNSTKMYNKANTLYQLQRYNEALDAYEKSLKVNPEYGEAWQGKGDVLQAIRQNKQALEAYDKAIQIQPENWRAWIGRAQILKKLGKNTEAIKSFEKAIQIQANAWQAWQGIAEIQIQLKQYVNAVKSLDNALKINRENAMVWYQKGWALQNLEKYEEALKAYDKAIELQADLSQVWYQKGNIFIKLNNYTQAIENYNQAVQFNPNASQAWYSLGIALNKLSRYSESISAFETVTELEPNNYEGWYHLAWTLHNLKRYEEAVNAYTTATQLRPKEFQAWYGKGNSLYNLGDYQQAITAYQKTIALEKNYYPAWKSLGHSRLKLKQYQKAIEAYDQTLRYKPDDQEATAGKAEAEKLSKNKDLGGNNEKVRSKTE